MESGRVLVPRRGWLRKKRFWLAAFVLSGPLLVVVSDVLITQSAAPNVKSDLADIPKRKAALVLGCSPLAASGRQNWYFQTRIEAAAALFHSGKTEYLIVSGDNSKNGYDEPTAMRDALIAKGVPATRIFRDFAGFRTLDSVVRARKIFDQSSILIVSQKFHNERAVFLAQSHGIDAIAFNAADVPRSGKMRLRELLSRVKAIADVWILKSKPKFLGPKVSLDGPPT